MLEFRKYNNVAGIYKWENKINHKCYIGQSINIGSRLRHHINSFKHKRYDNPLYRAFEKYGLDNFDIEVLFAIRNPEPCVKLFLDTLEIGYIEKYNSYGNTGYNQTRGGDGGILGYKFTKVQRKRVSEYSKRNAKLQYKRAYFYNLNTSELLEFESLEAAAKYFKLPHSSVSRVCNWKCLKIRSEWVGAFDKEFLNKRAEYVKNKIIIHKDRKRPTPKLNRRFNTPDGKKTISESQKEKIRNSLFKYKVEVYEEGKLIKTYNTTREANEFFNYKDASHISSQIRKYQKFGYKFKGKYTFRLI